MSTNSTGWEITEDIEADPDDVLDEFEVDAPEDLIVEAEEDGSAGGAHDPTTDAELDADDETAAELFNDLASVSQSLEAEFQEEDSAHEARESMPVPMTEERSERAASTGDESAPVDGEATTTDCSVSAPGLTVTIEYGSRFERSHQLFVFVLVFLFAIAFVFASIVAFVSSLGAGLWSVVTRSK